MNTLFSLLCFLSLMLPTKKLYIGREYSCDINKSDETLNKNFLTNTNYSVDYIMNLFENVGKYEIYYCCFLSSDMIYEMLLSYGSYTESNDSLILTDEVYGYDMHMKREKKKLTFTKSFVSIENKTFIDYHYNNDLVIYEWPYHYDRAQVKQENSKKYEAVNEFSCGVYHSNSMVNYYLEIDSIGYYNSYLEKVLISTGKWEQKGNELLLKDSSVDVVFSALITKEGLASQFIPGDYKGILLKKIR